MIAAIARIAAVCLLLAQVLAAAETDEAFGEAVNGLQLAISQPAAGAIRLVLLNHGPEAAQVQDGFGWVLLAESRDKACFTGKISFGEPATLAAGERRELKLRIDSLQLLVYEKGTKVVQGYPKVAAANTVAESALPLSVRAQGIAYVKVAGEWVTVKSKAVPILIRAEGGATSRPAEMAELIEQFRRDAFAAQAAHDRAVKIGPRALSTLVSAMADGSMPDFGSMWMATAVVHIGGQEGAAAAAELVLKDRREGVRDVVAYHGPSMRSDVVDRAILARAKAGNEPVFTAWAARGFAENGREFPPPLIDAAFESKEGRARAEIADVLARSGDVKRLSRLCVDENELVRVAASDAVKKHSVRDAAVIDAMLSSLELPGESSRQRMVESLAAVLGKPWTYDPQASEDKRVKLIEQIRKEAREAPRP